MNRTRTTITIVLLAFLALAGVCRAEDVWRLAGTFNSWDTRDDAWAMTPDGARAGVYVLEKRLPRGTSMFKFVLNGEWGSGHLGAADEGGLVQPGSDITLELPAEAVYTITLDTNTRTWSLDVADLESPIMIADVWGVPTEGRPFHIHFGRSLASNPERMAIHIAVTGRATVTPIDQVPQTVQVLPSAAGPLTLDVTLSDGGRPSVTRLDLDVGHPHSVELLPDGLPARTIELEPQGDGTSRGLYETDERTAFMSVRYKRGRGIFHQEPGAVLAEGSYAVVIGPDGLAPAMDAQAPAGFVPGAWRRFEVPAEIGTTSAHLIGEFNGWARPGLPGAIELWPELTTDGLVFAGLVNLPEGTHRYQVLYDGERVAPDPNADRQMPFEDGTPASVVVAGPTPADFDPPVPDRVNTRAVHHNPSSAQDLGVIGESIGLVEVGLRTLPDDVEAVTMLLDPDTPEQREVSLQVRKVDGGFDRWTARVLAGKPHLSYGFEVRDGPVTFRYGPFERELTGPTPDTPDWAMGAVWYQIFPERFRNGNPENDPHGPGYFRMPWTADWYGTAPGEEEQWRPRAGLGPDDPLEHRQGGDLYHWVWDRRYGGDLQGIVEKLDWIAELGVTALYLNPVFEADSMHKYDASSYHHIDDNFAHPVGAGQPPAEWAGVPGETGDPSTWVWTEADRYFLDVFLPACKERGIRVVLDGVFNHTGRNFWAFRDVIANGADSPYADWYFAEFDADGGLESWVAWDQPSGWLPKFRQDDDRNLVEPVKRHIFDITERWMDPNGDGDPSDGIDGWRLDVALDVGLPFWEEWRALVKDTNPDAVIIAEIWHDADEYLTGKHFDTHMHYPFAHAVTDWLAVRLGMTSAELHAELVPAFDNPEQVNLIHQNLYGSHDTDRLASQLFNPGRNYDDGNRIQDNGPNYKEGRPDERSFAFAKLAFAIQATYAGAPMIYYGDEVGMWGADDPTDRKPVPWPDLGPMDDPDETFDTSMREFAAEWLNLRHDPKIGPILRYGRTRPLDAGSPDVFAFERSLEGQRVRVIVNRGDRPYDASSLLDGAPEGAAVGPRSARWWASF